MTRITKAQAVDAFNAGKGAARLLRRAAALNGQADAIARAGNPASAGVFLVAAITANRHANEILAHWAERPGFAQGYAAAQREEVPDHADPA